MIQKDRDTHRKFFIPLLIGLGLWGYPLWGNAQAVLGAREMGVGQAVTALPGSGWSVFANPAMLPDQGSVSFFGVRYYGFAEISDMAASLIYPGRYGTLAAGVHRYGFDLFNESRFRAGYRHSFAGIRFGGMINYNHISQGGGYGSAGALGVDLGIAAPLIPGGWIGAKATNLNQPAYGAGNQERLPRNLSVGFSWGLSDRALFSTELFKESSFPLSYRGGVEVNVIGGLTGRAGVTTAPQSFSGGFGYRASSWSANLAAHRHENRILGYSPAIDFTLYW